MIKMKDNSELRNEKVALCKSTGKAFYKWENPDGHIEERQYGFAASSPNISAAGEYAGNVMFWNSTGSEIRGKAKNREEAEMRFYMDVMKSLSKPARIFGVVEENGIFNRDKETAIDVFVTHKKTKDDIENYDLWSEFMHVCIKGGHKLKFDVISSPATKAKSAPATKTKSVSTGKAKSSKTANAKLDK